MGTEEDNKTLINNISGSITEGLSKDGLAKDIAKEMMDGAKLDIAKSVYKDIQGKSMDETYIYSKISRPDDLQMIKDYQSNDKISDDDLIKMHNKMIELGGIEDQMSKMFDQSVKASNEASKEANEEKVMYTSNYSNIAGLNVPVSHNIDNISDDYPSHQSEIDFVTSTERKRASEHKNWKNALRRSSRSSYGGDGQESFLTWNDEKKSLSEDLDPNNGKNYLYKPSVISDKAFRVLHGLDQQDFSFGNTDQIKRNEDFATYNAEIISKLDDVLLHERIDPALAVFSRN